MTKKHFEALAAALRDQRETTIDLDLDLWYDTVGRISIVCSRFNPNFDRARFLAACRGDK